MSKTSIYVAIHSTFKSDPRQLASYNRPYAHDVTGDYVIVLRHFEWQAVVSAPNAGVCVGEGCTRFPDFPM